MQFLNKLLSYGFRLTKNIPIDDRFKIKHIDTVDTEIPQGIRYEGLIFSAEDNITDYQENTRRFYTFEISKENGKLVPVLLYDYLNRHVKLGIEVSPDEYGELNKILNENCYPVLGTHVYIKPLEIIVQWDGEKWKTIYGSIKVNSDSEFESIENNFKNQGWICVVNGNTKLILDNSKLSEPVLVGDTVNGITYGDTTYQLDNDFWNNNKEKGRFFLIDQTLYYNFNGKLYSVNNEIYVQKIDGSISKVLELSKFKTLNPKAFIVWGYPESNAEIQNILASSNPNILDFETSENLSISSEIECYSEKIASGNYKYYLDIPENATNGAAVLVILSDFYVSNIDEHI